MAPAAHGVVVERKDGGQVCAMFKCQHCPKPTFTTRQALNRHRKRYHTASGLWRYQCPFCSYKGYCRGEVGRHIKTKHSDKVGQVTADELVIVEESAPSVVTDNELEDPGITLTDTEDAPTTPASDTLSEASTVPALPPLGSPTHGTLEEEVRGREEADVDTEGTVELEELSSSEDETPAASQETEASGGVETEGAVQAAPAAVSPLTLDCESQTGSRGGPWCETSMQTDDGQCLLIQDNATQTTFMSFRTAPYLIRRTVRIETRPDGTRVEMKEEWGWPHGSKTPETTYEPTPAAAAPRPTP